MTENRENDYKFLGKEDLNDDKYDRQKRISGWDKIKFQMLL